MAWSGIIFGCVDLDVIGRSKTQILLSLRESHVCFELITFSLKVVVCTVCKIVNA